MRKSIWTRGADTARLFYDAVRFQRCGACPMRVVKTLFGKCSVQDLDGDSHYHRKTILMSVLTESKIDRLVATVEASLTQAAHGWQRAEEIEVLSALHEVLCRAACTWAGLQVGDEKAKYLNRNLATTIEGQVE